MAHIVTVFESINITPISFEDKAQQWFYVHNVVLLNWTINRSIRFSLFVERSSHTAHNAMTQVLLI